MERSVLNTLAHRLLAGQRKYGQLEEGKKTWTWEAAEECLDSSVYLAAGLIALTESSRRRYFSSLNDQPGESGGDWDRPSNEDRDRF